MVSDDLGELDEAGNEVSSEETLIDEQTGQMELPGLSRPRKTLEEMAKEAAAGSTGGSLICPQCECRDFRISNTWITAGGLRKRLRRCRNCGYPINSIEFVVNDD